MTNYQRMQIDKAFCASVISSAIYGADYEPTVFSPVVMGWLDEAAPIMTTIAAYEREHKEDL